MICISVLSKKKAAQYLSNSVFLEVKRNLLELGQFRMAFWQWKP